MNKFESIKYVTSIGIITCDALTVINLKIDAARKAIGIVNKLKPGKYRLKHISNCFKKLNRLIKLRGLLK